MKLIEKLAQEYHAQQRDLDPSGEEIYKAGFQKAREMAGEKTVSAGRLGFINGDITTLTTVLKELGEEEVSDE